MSPFFPIKNKKNIRSDIAQSSTNISTIKLELTLKSATVQVNPNTRRILNILLPTILPIAISDCFFRDAITDVTSSGADVPKATIVRPIIDSETPKDNAILLADPTSSSAPIHKPTSHAITNNIDTDIFLSSILFVSSLLLFPDLASAKVYEKNIIKNNKNIKLSHLVKIFTSAPEKNISNARNKRASDAKNEKGTSLYIVELFACRGYTSAAAPKTSHVFAIFDPITFHKASSVCHLKAERIFTKSSGADVPKATIVSPMTRADIHNLLAIEEAPSTSTSAHLIRTIKPITRYI